MLSLMGMRQDPYLKEFESVEQFKGELEKYMNYYNAKRLKVSVK